MSLFILGGGFFISPIFWSRFVAPSRRLPARAAVLMARMSPPVSRGLRPAGHMRCLLVIWLLL